MLWKRVFTAVILLPLLLWALFRLPAGGIAALIGVAVMIAVWEMSALAGFSKTWHRVLYCLALMTAGIAGSLWMLHGGDISLVLATAVLWWGYAIVHLFREEGSFGGVFGSLSGRITAGVLILLPTWLGFLFLFLIDEHAPQLLLYILVLVWVADSLAYFTGRAWGRHKLAPAVSPGKSVEGVVGGLTGVVLVAGLAGYYLWQLHDTGLIAWVAVSVIAGAVSVAGDLTESIFKRRAGVKDSGRLLPGHGGMFDRIDALTSAIPVFAFGWIVMRKAGL